MGAEQIALLPATAPCQAKSVAGETYLHSGRAQNYWFTRGDLVFTIGADSADGAFDFVVYRAGSPAGIFMGLTHGPIRFETGSSGQPSLHFTTIHVAECSIPVLGMPA
jgi:hypothetical protein